MIKLNLRWLVQALSLALGIIAFSVLFESSKGLFGQFTTWAFATWLFWLAIFCFSFLALMFTSYLKQRANFTLRNRLEVFEWLVRALRLENYRERSGVSDARQRKRTKDGIS